MLLRGLLREVDLPLKFEHPVFENADASNKRALVAFELDESLAVGLREGIERLQNLCLDVAHSFNDTALRRLDRVNDVLLACRFVAVLHGGTPFVFYARKGPLSDHCCEAVRERAALKRRGWCRRWDLISERALSRRKLLILLHAQCA